MTDIPLDNRLGAESSAYLRSAAHQPIHWYAWSAEPFAAARAADRPILLDIGAVWCHWCHVMDGESYEDPALAEFLNANFVCIKVDRDERPDVDARYQRAVQTLIRQGGWPLTAFLTPDGDVFYGGTYFPPDGRYGRPGFRSVLESVLEAYHGRRDQVGAQAAAIRRVLAEELNEAAAGDATAGLIEQAEAQMARSFDARNGGFGNEPKFPHPGAISLLLVRWHATRSAATRAMIDRTLQGMGRGGVYDQLGGGFHRYSVDAEWIVPHFEKMSYDNSELLRLYCDAFAAFGTEEYAETARGIVRWVRAVLADPEGGYGTSQDADVGLDDDGDYFTWTRDEAAAALAPEELDVAAAYYDIGTAGEMHHNPAKNVLFVSSTVDAIALRLGRPEAEIAAILDRARARLLAARDRRKAPFVDRSRYAAWNAMMAAAMLRAGAVLEDAAATEHALASLRRLRAEAPEPDMVPHTPGGVGGLLDDQVQVAAAALDAHEATGDDAWLEWAIRIMERTWRDHWDAGGGGLFDAASGGRGEGLLPTRAKPVQDAPTPSPNGVAGVTAARLHALTGLELWHERAIAIARAFAGRAGELGLHAAAYLLAVDWTLEPPTHLVIVASAPDAAEAGRMRRLALATYAPRRVVQRVDPASTGSVALPPAVSAMVRAAAGGSAARPRGYACVGASCSAPATGEEEWVARLRTLLHGMALDLNDT